MPGGTCGVWTGRDCLCTPGPRGCSQFLFQTLPKQTVLYRQTCRHPHSSCPHCFPHWGCWCPVPGNLPRAHSCPMWKCWQLQGQTVDPRDTGLMDKFCLLSSYTASPKTEFTQCQRIKQPVPLPARQLENVKHIQASSLPLTPAPWDCSS